MNTAPLRAHEMQAPEPRESPEPRRQVAVPFVLAFRCVVSGCGLPVTITEWLDYACSAGHVSAWAERADRLPSPPTEDDDAHA